MVRIARKIIFLLVISSFKSHPHGPPSCREILGFLKFGIIGPSVQLRSLLIYLVEIVAC